MSQNPSSGQQPPILIAHVPGDTPNQTAMVVRGALEQAGWQVTVSSRITLYASVASICVVILSPTTVSDPAVTEAINAGFPTLIPVLTEPMSVPYARWTCAPILFGTTISEQQTAIISIRQVLSRAAVPRLQPPYASVAVATAASPTVPIGGVNFSSNQFRSLILLLLTVVVVVVVVGGGLSILLLRSQGELLTSHAPPTTIPAGFKVFVDPGGNFQLLVPQDWGTSGGAGISIFIDPSRSAVFDIGGPSTALSSSDIASNEAAFFQNASTSGGGDGTYSVTVAPSRVTLAGESWTKEEGDVAVARGTLHAVVLIANHGSNSFTIGYAAVYASFTEFNSQDFQTMQHSFVFLK